MTKYSIVFKEEAIRLSDKVRNKKATAQFVVPYYTFADWRNHSKHKPKGPVRQYSFCSLVYIIPPFFLSRILSAGPNL